MARTVGSIYGSSARSSGPLAGALPAACTTMTGCTMEDSRNRSVKIAEIAIVDVYRSRLHGTIAGRCNVRLM